MNYLRQERETLEGLLALDEALTRLQSIDPTAAKLVKLWHFAGLTMPRPQKSSACPCAPPSGTGPVPAPGCMANWRPTTRRLPQGETSPEKNAGGLCIHSSHYLWARKSGQDL